MIEFGPKEVQLRKIMRKVSRRRGRGTAAALVMPMGMAPTHPKSRQKMSA